MTRNTTSENLDVLKTLKIQTIRQSIRPECYQRSTPKALFTYAFDGLLYLAAIAGIWLIPYWWAQLLLGLVAGSAVAFMFVWAHDAAHGALFENRHLAEVLGTLFMLPSFNMYRLWAFGHNRVHHGFTSLSAVDWIWRPLTPQEYGQKNAWQKMIYRLERSPYTCALHYLLRVWWPGMIRFKADQKNRRAFTLSKLLTLLFFILFSCLSWWMAGPMGFIAAVLLPFLVFNYYIALFVFLHHTHPDIPFFMEKEEWSQSIGQLYCSSVVRCSKISEKLIHNILIHAPHHVDPRIPYYHLEAAYADLRAAYGQYIHEIRFSFKEVRHIFRSCKLYDYESRQWMSFRSGRSWIEQKASALSAAANPTVYPGKTVH
ncbi:fatty acid desaturase [Acidithiobacillus marinus]|uniref:Fatty acid desaturase n=1 Tax=Acidithiobacillus marinus TaxID=187490 RepID=A0A2I1DJ36_9PROT|nr:fatty acid desaturase [Acidithiobacillus marinus]PKY09879.1 fatty acid desaturase [Acidithiobacillus marinus]